MNTQFEKQTKFLHNKRNKSNHSDDYNDVTPVLSENESNETMSIKERNSRESTPERNFKQKKKEYLNVNNIKLGQGHRQVKEESKPHNDQIKHKQESKIKEEQKVESGVLRAAKRTATYRVA